MSKSIMCDNCKTAVPDRPDDTLSWIKVGWKESGIDDACSIDCARALLDQMQQVLWDFEEEEAAKLTEA